MKLDKIMIKEAKNEADIVLYRHGLFLRAYERSTYHLSTLCQFKVIYKYMAPRRFVWISHYLIPRQQDWQSCKSS